MNAEKQLASQAFTVSRFDREDGYELAADLGSVGNASVDVVDDTVIVVVGDDQYEIEVDGDAKAFMKNGVLTIEVEE